MNALLRRFGLAVFVTVLGCSGSGSAPGGAPSIGGDDPSAALALKSATQPQTITILHVNDSHSVLDAIGPKDAELGGKLGGLTKAATVIERLRADAPDALFLHAGDVFEGDLTFLTTSGVLELQLLKWLGLDAFTLGNHEFDYGPDLLASSLLAAGIQPIPVLSANLVKPAQDHPLSRLVSNHVVKNVGGVRVGIFGLTTPDDPLMQVAPFVVSNELAPIVAAEVTALRSPPASADVVILLSHLDPWLNQAIVDTPGNGIDFIVAGHDESEQTFAAYTPGQTAIVEAGNFYKRVGRLEIDVSQGHIVGARHTLVPVNEDVPRDRLVSQRVSEAQRAVDRMLGFDAFRTQVAYADGDLENLWNETMGPRRDVAVGDLAADALKAKFGAQLGLTTSGFLNDKIYDGPVVANDLFRALPYGINPMLLGLTKKDAILPDPALAVTLSGLQLYTGFEVALAFGEVPQLSEGALACYDSTAEPYTRVKFIVIDGVPVQLTDSKTVALNIVMWEILNQAFAQAGLPSIPLPANFDPFVSQFSTLLEYAAGKTLSTPADARVMDLPGDGCLGLLGL